MDTVRGRYICHICIIALAPQAATMMLILPGGCNGMNLLSG
ncbi:MAG: hypothetical protein ABIT36_12245 [Steroidobacteraceae bacterium]